MATDGLARGQGAPTKYGGLHGYSQRARFVEDLARRLIAHGIDAWYDKWEIQAGDSLVDKIFEEGLKNAKAIIIVLSHVSVQKPWVREELNAGIIKKINKQTRVIPVIIDSDCEVPEALQSTKWVNVPDLQNYDDALRQIENAIHGLSDKPQLGQPPRHVQLSVDKMPGLSSIDTKVFKAAYETALSGESKYVNGNQFSQAMQEIEVSDQNLLESLDILHDRHLIQIHREIGTTIPLFEITARGFENYGKFYIENFDQLVKQTLLSVLNYDLRTNGDIADKLGVSLILSELLLDMLEKRKYIKVGKFLGGSRSGIVINDVTTLGRRFAEQQE